VLSRLKARPEIIEVSNAPCQEVVEKDPDLRALPVHLQHGLDGAPYVSASTDFTVDQESGWVNVGMRRLMLRGRREAGVDLVAPSDLRAIYLARAKRGEALPIAFVVGSHRSTTWPRPCASRPTRPALSHRCAPRRRRSKCVSQDSTTRRTRYVLEGYRTRAATLSPNLTANSPPPRRREAQSVFHLTAVTWRRDPALQSRDRRAALARTDTAQLCALRTEVTVWRSLETAVRETRAVYATPSSGGMYNVRIALNQRVPGEARNAIAAVLGSLANAKHVFVVDPDIDVFSDEQVDWALATRFQADRDLVVASGMRTLPLDQSRGGSSTGAKAGFDLTFKTPPSLEQRVPRPPQFDGKRFGSLQAALAEGPKFFAELMAAVGSRDGREIVRELETLRALGKLSRDLEGRFELTRRKERFRLWLFSCLSSCPQG
jgi:3-polyprenyl-4-hydroxybenzoate decarboxylase